MAGHFARLRHLSKAHQYLYLLEGANKRITGISCRLTSTASSVDIAGKRDKNIVYSRHEDCELHNLTVVQRFFDQASKWPHHIALVTKFVFGFLNIQTLVMFSRNVELLGVSTLTTNSEILLAALEALWCAWA